MVYARCLYQILLKADKNERDTYPITRGKISYFIHHAISCMHCRVKSIKVGSGYVVFLADVSVFLSIEEFVINIKSWTSQWIIGKDNKHDYWQKGFWYSAVSPEDKEAATNFLGAINIKENAAESAMTYCACIRETEQALKICHHIIFITSRSRLLIPSKYKRLLCEEVGGAAHSLGAEAIACSAMRNHVHLLCTVPININLSWMLEWMRKRLIARILSNPHLRRMEGMSDDMIVHTVSNNRIQQEVVNVLDQENVHWHCYPINEMSFIYQKMDITYFTSLH